MEQYELRPTTGNCCVLAIPLKWRPKLSWRNSVFSQKCYHSESKPSLSHPLPEVTWILVAEEVTWDMSRGCMSIISHFQLLPQGIINKCRKIGPVPTVMGNRQSSKDREIGIGFWGLIVVSWVISAFFRLMDTPARFLRSHTGMSTNSTSLTRCGCIFCACFLIFCKYLAAKLWNSQDVWKINLRYSSCVSLLHLLKLYSKTNNPSSLAGWRTIAWLWWWEYRCLCSWHLWWLMFFDAIGLFCSLTVCFPTGLAWTGNAVPLRGSAYLGSHGLWDQRRERC